MLATVCSDHNLMIALVINLKFKIAPGAKFTLPQHLILEDVK